MRVVLFTRRPRRHQNFSMELIVASLVPEFAREFHVEVATCKYESSGVFRRIYNTLEASCRQGDVNHITGDVHYLTFLLHKRRTILTIHDCAVILGKATLRKRLLKLLWFTLPAKRSAFVTVVSENTKRDVLRLLRLPADKVRVIPSVVPEIYSYSPKPFASECPTILHVGTAAHKNLDRVAEALRGLRCRLIVVGKLSPAQSDVLERCGIDYVNYVGISTERLLKLYESADIVAFASLYEGFGMPIIEANRVGRPVVVGNCSSMPEVAGDAACLVEPQDVASIHAGFLRIINDPTYRETLVQRGLENAKRFEASAVARMYEELYRAVAASSGVNSPGAALLPAAANKTSS